MKITLSLIKADTGSVGGHECPSQTMMKKAIDDRKQNPIFCVDISVPRNVDPAIHRIENIYLYNIDDLHSIIKENYKSREEEALKAEVIVQEEVQKFLKKFS